MLPSQADAWDNFRDLNAIFVHYLTELVNWNVDKRQQGTRLLSSRLSEDLNDDFLMNNCFEFCSNRYFGLLFWVIRGCFPGFYFIVNKLQFFEC